MAALHRHLKVTAGVQLGRRRGDSRHFPARASRPPASGLPGVRRLRSQPECKSASCHGILITTPPTGPTPSLLWLLADGKSCLSDTRARKHASHTRAHNPIHSSVRPRLTSTHTHAHARAHLRAHPRARTRSRNSSHSRARARAHARIRTNKQVQWWCARAHVH